MVVICLMHIVFSFPTVVGTLSPSNRGRANCRFHILYLSQAVAASWCASRPRRVPVGLTLSSTSFPRCMGAISVGRCSDWPAPSCPTFCDMSHVFHVRDRYIFGRNRTRPRPFGSCMRRTAATRWLYFSISREALLCIWSPAARCGRFYVLSVAS